jgi:glycosyltransferase involved in cell wall biosynthesis
MIMEESDVSNILSPHEGEDEDTLVFSVAQIEYLREEFERQRRWVTTLSAREKAALQELENTQNSVSYRVGRFLTWLPRKFLGKFRKRKHKIIHFVEEDDAVDETENLFPSSLLITPELLPESGERLKPDVLVEDLLMTVRRRSLSVNVARDMILDASYGMEPEDIEEALNRSVNHMLRVGEYLPSVRNVFIASIRSLAQRNTSAALRFGEKWIEELPDERAFRTLIQLHGRSGNFTRPIELLQRVPRDEWRRVQSSRFSTAARIMEEGLDVNFPPSKNINSDAGSIIYHASQSMPHTTSGYAIRTHGLVTALNDKDWKVRVHLRHGYPLDRSDFRGESVSRTEEIDGTDYIFHPASEDSMSDLMDYTEVFNFSGLERYQGQAVRTLMRQAEETRPALIHSASNFVVGLAGAEAARLLGIPSIYEIRGFWHLTQATKRAGYEQSDHYLLSERLEIETAKKSDHVFVITNSLRDILIDAGVEPDKVTVIPNAVDPTLFDILPREKELERDLGYEGKVVIGYIGSFVEYEGLELLLEAVAKLRGELGDTFRLLMVGDGSIYESLRRMTRFLQIEDIVKFTGRVPFDEVQRYYSLIDIIPLPRLGLRVCELVSPLKPFEAMGTGKVLITSDVAALAEIVDDGVTGLLHRKDDADHLAEKLSEAIQDEELRNRLGAQAREWVCETHSWEVISRKVTDVYNQLTGYQSNDID